MRLWPVGDGSGAGDHARVEDFWIEECLGSYFL